MSRIAVKPLHQEIAQRIREMIRKGVLHKGDRIAEKELSQAMGTSRTPLREALRLLSSEGLVDLIPHKGAYVAQPSMREISEMFEVVSLLEGTCARKAAEKMTEADLRKLEKLHDKLEKYFKDKNSEKYLEANYKYHSALQEIAGSKVLSDVIDSLKQKVMLYRHRQLYQPDRFEASINEHRDLLDAFRRRDPAAAEAAMRTHLTKQCEALRSVYEDEADRTDS